MVGRRKCLYFPTALHGPVVTCDTSVRAEKKKALTQPDVRHGAKSRSQEAEEV